MGIANNHDKVLNTQSVNTMQSLQGVTAWTVCDHCEVRNTHSVSSMQSLQGAKYKKCE